MKLTQRTVDATTALPAGKTDVIHFDDDLACFGLRLRAGGSRTFVVNYKIGGKPRRVTLGPTSVLTAAQARERAREILAKVRLGGDPASDKATARGRAGETFAAMAKQYLIRKGPDLRPRSYAAADRYLMKHFRPLHGLALTVIDRRMIAARLGEIAASSGPAAADRGRAALSAFFTWAMKEGLVEANPTFATNRAGTKPRKRTLNIGEIIEVWQAAGGDAYGAIIKLLILTGQRRNEIGSLRWQEINFSARLIQLPSERTKNGQPHDVHLSEPTMHLLQTAPRIDDFVFGTSAIGFCAYSDGKTAIDARIATARQAAGIEPIAPWVLHDLRRSVATHMAEIGIQPHVIEAVLNHSSGHKAGVAGIYNRATYATEKRAALDLWGRHMLAMVDAIDRKA